MILAVFKAEKGNGAFDLETCCYQLQGTSVVHQRVSWEVGKLNVNKTLKRYLILFSKTHQKTEDSNSHD